MWRSWQKLFTGILLRRRTVVEKLGKNQDRHMIQNLPGVTYIELGKFSRKMIPEEASKQLRVVDDLGR